VNVFGKLFGKDKETGPSHWVTFDCSEFKVMLDEPSRILWQGPTGVDQLIQHFARQPGGNFDLDDMDAARRYWVDQCSSLNGVMLCIDKETVGGVDILHAIFKYRDVDNFRAMHFIGIIWILFAECSWQINIESIERGITGVREAIVFAKYPELQEVRQIPEEISSKFQGPEDIEAYIKSQPLIALASDEERFDSVNDKHPLTLVRRRLRRVVETMKFSPEVRKLKKFKL